MQKYDVYFVVLNTVIPFLSAFTLGRCLLISIAVQNKIRADSIVKDVRWLLSEDRVNYELTMRLFIVSMLLSNLIVGMNGMNRLVIGAYSYPSFFVEITSTLFCILMCFKAYLLLALFKNKKMAWVRKLFNFTIKKN